jgi:hypothetical protein
MKLQIPAPILYRSGFCCAQPLFDFNFFSSQFSDTSAGRVRPVSLRTMQLLQCGKYFFNQSSAKKIQQHTFFSQTCLYTVEIAGALAGFRKIWKTA